MRRMIFTAACLALFLAQTMLAPASLAQKSETSALINEALDKLVKLNWNATLPQVMQQVSKDYGIRIEASPAVWELLPWGEQTNISAKIENQTLRQALEAITRKLGLTFVLKDEAIELQPMPALARLGRRSTVQELQSLDLLISTPLELGNERPSFRQVVGAVDAKLVDLKSPYTLESRPGDAVNQDAPVFVPRGATLMDALESIAKDTRATWYPWGKSIIIVPKEDQARTLLAKSVTIRYNGVDVSQVLAELSQRSGVDFTIQPGAIQRIPPEFRTVRLLLDNASIRQALESICGFTGLGYVVNEHGVYVWNESNNPASPTRAPLFALIQLDNGVQVPVRENDVPPDLREYINHRMTRQWDKLREMMKEEGFKPKPPATGATTGNQDL